MIERLIPVSCSIASGYASERMRSSDSGNVESVGFRSLDYDSPMISQDFGDSVPGIKSKIPAEGLLVLGGTRPSSRSHPVRAWAEPR